ncbi:sporulation phosphorelay system protein KapB [Bacillus horti]|uniref:Kinase-associated protein B n=1 Tax=Caldalkalibacillus horti TaxID=77523 RepID=A0ABT9W2D2_9BACI|nr:sporulation phosphorelay system protein KapB [Bacillus horti]MDQ0167407.1 kinase-associated protein B [Bacillus horti]
MSNHLEPGAKVQALYKSGLYAGELIEVRANKAVVQILAVLKHPTQGDLHQPFEADVAMFHQRRALAYKEKALVPFVHLSGYDQEIPEYKASLKEALQAEMNVVLERRDQWGEQAYVLLKELEKEYF